VRCRGSHVVWTFGTTYGGEVLSLKRGLSLTPKTSSITGFCWRLSKPRAIVQLEGIHELKVFSDLIGNRIRNISACNVAPELYTIPHAPNNNNIGI
jgi:hypothetical protein